VDRIDGLELTDPAEPPGRRSRPNGSGRRTDDDRRWWDVQSEPGDSGPAARTGAPSRAWWVAGVLAVVVAGLLGALIATVVQRGGSADVCPARDVAAKALPSVVTIKAQGSSGAGTGSGEVIRSDGYVLTNDHVIAPAGRAGQVTVVLDDGTALPARIQGRDPATDLAVLKVDSDRVPAPIRTGSSADLVVGQPVVALGAPLGLSSTVTVGVVSALGRTVRVPSEVVGSALLVSAVQTDASINPGNSGGALVDCDSRLVGVPTAGATVPEGGGGSIGIGFAIPVDSALRIADQLISTGSVRHAYVGLQVAPFPPEATDREGLFVTAAAPAGPAAAAGLRAGDVITALDGEPAGDAEQLEAISLTRSPGDRLNVTYRRDGASADATITLGAAPAGAN
jgi:putative serine protease PepD